MFTVFFEDDNVDGFQLMEALRSIKGYHHVQDVTKAAIQPAQGEQAKAEWAKSSGDIVMVVEKPRR